ncbi:hypothetical protein [Novosphingopyxis sp.]|uniref:hypothetical protein n=1 Tax=Novosphingopyxis sp. TaxID=2709690 RepID=UPI003B5CB667
MKIGLNDMLIGSDLRNLLILLSVVAATSVFFTILAVKFRPHWSRRRAIILAALPIPAAIWAGCAALVIHSMTASKQECGVDACGMVMMFSVMIAIAAAFAFLIGLVAAALANQKYKT